MRHLPDKSVIGFFRPALQQHLRHRSQSGLQVLFKVTCMYISFLNT